VRKKRQQRAFRDGNGIKHKADCPRLSDDHFWCQCGALGSVDVQRRAYWHRCALHPGRRWRLLAQGPGRTELYGPDYDRPKNVIRSGDEFDEVVVDHWLHVERMDKRDWWASIGDARIWIRIAKNGDVQVNIERGEYGPVRGTTTVPTERNGS